MKTSVCTLPTCGYIDTSETASKTCPVCGFDSISASKADKLQTMLMKRSELFTQEDLQDLLSKRTYFARKYADKPKLKKIWPQIGTLWDLLASSAVPFRYKAIAGAAIAYVLSPIDLIPDFIPIVGFLDDVVIVLLALWLLGSAIYEFLNPDLGASELPLLVVACVAPSDHKLSEPIDQRDNVLLRFMRPDEITLSYGFRVSGHSAAAGRLFLAHPLKRNTLVPFDDADNQLQKERWNEMDSLFAALNAKSVVLRTKEDSSASVKASGTYQKIFGISGSAEGKKTDGTEVLVSKKYQDSGGDQWVDFLENAAWVFEDEGLWNLVSQRIVNGLSEYRVNYKLRSKYEGHAKAMAKVPKLAEQAGMSCSGELGFSKTKSYDFDLKVSFHPADTKDIEDARTVLRDLIDQRRPFLKTLAATP
jgi:uncharacterized membrane protein YkvA (DUF1232 family)